MKKRVIECVLVVLCLLGAKLHAQQTIVSGVVIDKKTREPLPFAAVQYQDSKIGATTDVNGQFYLATYYATDTLVVKFLGYEEKKIKVKKDVEQRLTIELVTSGVGLGEVVIKYDKEQENPAHPIIRRVI
ncbi:MAG TPA: carboxypeptidase-like regulatory domain-containing protein, partial [Luteibaculaceae bacterium]|nr:carboxypeptidase-like regulatory domain-containing protein [Luteibaculaceae bacterium]